MESHRVKPRRQTVAIATVELVETLHQSFPDAVIKPSEPFEDEDVCLTVYGLWDVEELQRIRNQIYKLEFTLYGQVRRWNSGRGENRRSAARSTRLRSVHRDLLTADNEHGSPAPEVGSRVDTSCSRGIVH